MPNFFFRFDSPNWTTKTSAVRTLEEFEIVPSDPTSNPPSINKKTQQHLICFFMRSSLEPAATKGSCRHCFA